MRGKLSFALLFSGLLSMCLFQDYSLYAKDTLEDGIIGFTKEEVREKFGKPPYLYCEEEPYRRYVIVKPENESILRATFLYDVIVLYWYSYKISVTLFIHTIYFGEDVSDGKNV